MHLAASGREFVPIRDVSFREGAFVAIARTFTSTEPSRCCTVLPPEIQATAIPRHREKHREKQRTADPVLSEVCRFFPCRSIRVICAGRGTAACAYLTSALLPCATRRITDAELISGRLGAGTWIGSDFGAAFCAGGILKRRVTSERRRFSWPRLLAMMR